MEKDQLLVHLKRLLRKIHPDDSIYGTHTEICEFLRLHLSPRSVFLEAIQKCDPHNMTTDFVAKSITENVKALIDSIEEGVHQGISPERQAELDVVSDFLGMAHRLLETAGVHPAAPAVLIGATLEEFLRTWLEAEGLELGKRKPGLEAYSQILRDKELITKQDGKDITAWAGIRNHAAHGEWEEVSDKERIALMLEGVNLFIRKNTLE
jgi:hypothetical protein